METLLTTGVNLGFLCFDQSQNHLENARLCLKDCSETTCPVELASEIESADTALESAVNSYIDVLDSLRAAAPEQQQAYDDDRNAGHGPLKELRRQLDELRRNRIVTSASSESE
jgi:hypothetical protein